MSRTYKNNSPSHYHRRLSGWKNAIINNARKKAIPPNPWDDKDADSQCWQTRKNISNMFKNGIEIEEIEKRVRQKRKMPYWIWHDITRMGF